jgi:hypothetical protein
LSFLKRCYGILKVAVQVRARECCDGPNRLRNRYGESNAQGPDRAPGRSSNQPAKLGKKVHKNSQTKYQASHHLELKQ